MAVFEYKGFDAAGKSVKGVIDADSAKGARSKLRRQQMFPTDIWEQTKGKATRGKGLNIEVDLSRFTQRVSVADLSALTSQLSTLVGAGIPMVEALSALVDQVENPALKPVLVEIREDVNQGDGLAKAMKKHRNIFSDLYINMVAAGESSGSLDIVLKRLTEYTEATVKLRGEVLSALMYPVLMGFVSLAIVSGMFIFVIPKVRRIFDSFNEALPLPTQGLLTLSDFLVGYWWLTIIVVAGSAYGFFRWVRTKEGRRKWHQFLLTMPIFGRVNRLVAVSRFCRTLSTLLDSGVPILSAIKIVETVVGNDVIAEAVGKVGDNIREGQSIAGPLKASGQFPPLVTHMITIGEKTGELEPMLGKVADSYDQQVENTLRGMTSLLEPLLIVCLGGVVAFIAMALILPMLNMSAVAT
jgi:general secretion pathway protein F